jgi:hypothetical protein
MFTAFVHVVKGSPTYDRVSLPPKPVKNLYELGEGQAGGSSLAKLEQEVTHLVLSHRLPARGRQVSLNSHGQDFLAFASEMQIFVP